MAFVLDVEGGDEEEYVDVPHGNETVCYTTTPGEKPTRDAMTGHVLDRSQVAVARHKAFNYFLASDIW